MVANINQFNGECGCGNCLDPGTGVKKQDGQHVQIYPLKNSSAPTKNSCQLLYNMPSFVLNET
jgi:hypothetical protein